MAEPQEVQSSNRYVKLIEKLFEKHFKPGMTIVPFERDEIERLATQLKIQLPKNLGDLIYTFRYRMSLPVSITRLASHGMEWVIRGTGRSRYAFELTKPTLIVPNMLVAETKLLDATPGIIEKYALSDEQALLAKVRYNRLIDVITGITCYSLQSHLRTTVPNMGQVETDEVYVGMNRAGVQFVLPVQAKGGRDRLNLIQIEQDLAMCARKFPSLVCKPVAAQFMKDDLIALFVFDAEKEAISIAVEKHYRLVTSDGITETELQQYQARLEA
jgi:hypothetical protein